MVFNNGLMIQFGWHKGTGNVTVITIQYPISYEYMPKVFTQLITGSSATMSNRSNSIIPGSVTETQFQIYSWSVLDKWWFSIGH